MNNKNLKIGFTNSPFPVIKNSEHSSKTYILPCLRQNVKVTVSQCKLRVGKFFDLNGIITTSVRVANKLFMNGWGQHTYYDEAKTMKKAVELYCEEHNLELFDTYNNWNTFRGSVQKKI